MTAVMWFRRDLRLRDNPALRAAAANGDVLGLFVLDPVLWRSAGAARRGWLAASLRALDQSMDGRLCIRLGAPASVVPSVLAEVGATALHVANDCTPYARTRDRAVVAALPESVSGLASGTPYAVPPGSVRNGSGDPYKVYTPFSKAWRAFGWDDPSPAPRGVGRGRERPASRGHARRGHRRGSAKDADGR
ncbi:deoxyribodipyrimidine photo-lyase [Nocardioides sp. InS609-2]|uniref:deoxyribodipyrimidine photo-lyase n=1 Tax=Nocardioides sp. InS609-2 TaxID=2760705 RepID=UPI0020C062A9|nr:deoxyribodipyrimidine photo-lyase [Nocardioides sp. InS609-2]